MRSATTHGCVLLSAAVLGLALPDWTSSLGRDGAATEAAAEGTSNAHRRLVTAIGRLEPGPGIIEVGGMTGRRVGELCVQPDQVVQKGEPLAYLDDYDALAEESDHVTCQLREARDSLAAEVELAQRLLDEAELGVQRAQRLTQFELQVLEARVRGLQVHLEASQRELKRSVALQATKSLSDSEFDRVQLDVDAREEELAEAQAQLAQLQSEQSLRLLEAQAKVGTAQANLAAVRQTRPIDSLERACRVAQARRELSVVRAPVAGRILKVHTYPGEVVGQFPILSMGVTDEMYAVAEVYETDVKLVASGASAKISSSALASTIQGQVEEISRLIDKNDVLNIDPLTDSDTRVVEVRIRLEESSLAARFIHLQVDVAIDVHPPSQNGRRLGSGSAVSPSDR